MYSHDDSGLYGIGSDLAQHIDGAIDAYRVHSHVGETRRLAMDSAGRDTSVSLASGELPEAQIDTFVAEVLARQADGPVGYCWFVLRKVGKPGNIATSKPIRVGGEDSIAHVLDVKDKAMSSAIGMGPQTLNLLSGLLTKALDSLTEARADESAARVMMSHAIGAAEAGDESAKWEAFNSAVEHGGPVLKEALRAWTAMKGGGADPSKLDPNQAGEWFNGLSDDTRAQLAAMIVAAAQREAAEDAAAGAEAST